MTEHVTATTTRAEVGRPIGALSPTDPAGGVLSRVREVIGALPEAVAVADDERAMTFAEVAAEAAAIAGSLRAARPGAGEPVALLHPHTVGAVPALLAILATGHPVVVLDHRTPSPRLQMCAERTGAALVLSPLSSIAVAAQVGTPVVVEPGAGGPVEELWQTPIAPDAPAALAFTSGSTGRPKIVVNSHRMLVRDAWTNSAATGCYGADDVVGHTLPLAFHAGLMVTVAGLLVGARMELYDVRGAGIGGVPEWVRRRGVTVMHCSPAILRALVSTAPAPELFTTVRSLTIAGETAHGRDVEAARVLLPRSCVIRNRYGSSETGLIAEYPVSGDHPPLAGPLPVGRGVGDTVLRVADERGEPVPPGEPGRLEITSGAPADGYWDDPASTAATFRANPDGTRTVVSNDVAVIEDRPDGSVVRLLGRRDHSVKIRGYLVEPGEVDAELFTLPDVVEALTVARPRPGGDSQRLVAYVVSSAEQPNAMTVRRALRERLPGHMVPEVVLFLAALPRTDRGKLDRAALPEPPPMAGPDSYGPMSDWEIAVADVWARALELDTVGPDQDFFELGGDSLAAEAMIARVVEDLGIAPSQVTAAVLVEAPTVREFAARIRREPDPLGAVLVPLGPAPVQTVGTPPVTPIFLVAGGGGLGVAFVPLARRLRDRPCYALQMHGMERRGLPDWTVGRSARRNIAALRTAQPEGPYVIAGHSYGGLVARAMADRLHRDGEQVALLAILDSFPPDPARHPAPEPKPLLRRLRAALGLLATGWATTPGTGNYWRFYDLSTAIGRHHRSRRAYPGRTVVMVADSEHRADRSAWGEHLSGPWSLVEVPGDHLSMLREPHVAGLADALQQALDDALGAPPDAGSEPLRQ